MNPFELGSFSKSSAETESKLEKSQLEKGEHKETPARFRLAVEAALMANFSSIEVIGEENLSKLPPDAKVIFATTHISDFDVVIPIAKLGKQFKIKAVNASVQYNFSEDAMSNLALRLAGKDNAIPVDYKWGEHEKAGKSYYTKAFNPDNFTPMNEALEEGDAVVMAAYNPPQVKDGKLPEKGAYGAVYLAEISGATIVPIAINIESEDPNMGVRKTPLKSLTNRPKAQMIIGEPITPTVDPEVKNLPELMKQEGRESIEKICQIKNILRTESDKVMLSLVQSLPEEKRGEWGKKSSEPEV